jgi:hypothetical protein
MNKRSNKALHLTMIKRRAVSIILLLAALLLESCAYYRPAPIVEPALAYIVGQDDGWFSAHSPVFLIEESGKSYNLIGTPTAVPDEEGGERIYVDSALPTIYTLRQSFDTESGVYTNLYYRVHFEKSPFSIIPFNVSAGQNTGLIVVVTLNQGGEPLLYTTVHTCGCYHAFVPTSFLPDKAFPPGWSREGQRVYGEKLPGILRFLGGKTTGYRAVISLRRGSHRVKGFSLVAIQDIQERHLLQSSSTLPMEALESLPMEDGSTTSFFEEDGPRKDYVKGSHKPWEKLFISWWVLDWRVGEDKIFRPDRLTDTIFYTSMKFWDRNESDMEDFVTFLRFWGWGL